MCCLACREAFDLFDTDGSGTIDAKELKVAMRYVSTLSLAAFKQDAIANACMCCGQVTNPCQAAGL